MSRLIDADEIFYDQLLNTGHKGHPLEFAVSKKRIDDMPTIEPQQWIPVTKEEVFQAGYEGREIRFRVNGRLFAIREFAQ